MEYMQIRFMTFQVNLNAPSAENYCSLRASVGWDATSVAQANTALKNSLFHITITENNTLVAMGRVIGDGTLFFYIQDVVVHPKLQGKGLGNIIMVHIEQYLAEHACVGATIGLFAAKGKESFYKTYGYKERNGKSLGLGMCKFL